MCKLCGTVRYKPGREPGSHPPEALYMLYCVCTAHMTLIVDVWLFKCHRSGWNCSLLALHNIT